MQPTVPVNILIADDDSDDILLMRKAFKANRLANRVDSVADGEQLLDRLHQRGAYADRALHPRPGLVFLDLNMPKVSGKEALVEIRATPTLRALPVVVLTTSALKSDIAECYNLGATSYIVKPVTMEGIMRLVQAIDHYWFELVDLPSPQSRP